MLSQNRFTDPLLLSRKETQLSCKECGSDKQAKFTAEIAVHFPGRSNLNKPHVLVFPQILVCLNCGIAGFIVPESQLRILSNETNLGQDEPQKA